MLVYSLGIENLGPNMRLPAAHAVHVWGIDLQRGDAEVAKLFPLLNNAEQGRAMAFRRPEAGRMFIVARAMLRRILAAYTGDNPARIRFSYTAYGKPELASATPAPLHFNLAHAGRYALYAIAARRVGIDIEEIRSDFPWQVIAAEYFAPYEYASILRRPRDEQHRSFFEYWALKEAYTKGRGEGLGLDFRSFTIGLAPEADPLLINVRNQPAEAPRWRLRLLKPTTNYVAALALEVCNENR